MKCSVPAAQWCCYYHTDDTAGDIQSLEQQAEWEEEAVEEIIIYNIYWITV